MLPKTKEQKEKEEAERLAAEEEAKRKAKEEETSTEEDPESEEEEEDLSPDELKAKLAESEKARRAANKEAKERRLKLEALEKEKKDREEAELSEKDKLEKRAKEAEDRLASIEQENRSLKLSQEFARKTGELKLSFASEKARETGLNLLDLEKVGDDFDGLEDELKRLAKDHSYLFGKADPDTFINDGSRKSKVNASTVTKESISKQRQTQRINGL